MFKFKNKKELEADVIVMESDLLIRILSIASQEQNFLTHPRLHFPKVN